MDILVNVFLPLALAFIMFSLGLGLTIGDFIRVAQRPKAFAIGALNQLVLLPLVTFAFVLTFGLRAEIAVGFMLLAACPGGVTSNVISKFARADVALSVSLTAVISLVSAVTVPLLLALSMDFFMGAEAISVNTTGIAVTLFALTVVPITTGLILRRVMTQLTLRIEPLISRIAAILFVVIVLVALASNWSLFAENVVIMGPAQVLLILVLLALGFSLSRVLRLSVHEAKTISIETGIQSSAMGITVAALLVPDVAGFSEYALPAATYGILMYLVPLPIVAWYRRMGQ